MARLGFMARWHCDRCGLGFEDYDACEAHEAGCDGTGGDAGAGAQDQGQQPEQGPPAPVVIPQDDDEDGGRPAAAVPQRAPHQLPGQPPAPAIIPIHNDGDNIAGGSVSAAGHRQAAAPGAEAAVAQPAREAAQEAIDLTIDDSNSDGDGSSDDDNDDDDDEVVVVDDAGTGQSRRAHAQNVSANQQAGAPPAVAAAAPPPPKRGVVTVWTCDVCGVAEFSTFEAAAAHEEACAAKKEREDAEAAAAATAATRKAQQQREAATATATASATAQNRVSSDQQHPSHQQNQQQVPIALAMAALPPPLQPNRLLQQGAQPQPQPQAQKAQQQAKAPGSGISKGQQQQHASNSNINPVFRQRDTKYWSCDICNASFQSYEEACKHERNCEGNPNAPVKSITTFRGADGRPISDEASQLTEPVTLDDDQEPQSSAPPPAPYWTCDHCQVARFDTYDQASAHERICRAVAKQLGRNDGGTAATTNNSNTAAAPKPTPPTAPNLERMLIVANPGQQRTLPQDFPQKIQIPSGTVFPLMHEQFTKDKSLTVPPHVALALDQLVLAIKDADTGEGTPLAASSALIELDLCCRHCKEHFPVTSTNRLGFDVERVINGHFMGKAVCKSMPVDIPELMDKLQNTARMHGTDEDTKASIRSYSQYIVEQYSLVNLTDLKAEKTIGMVSFKDNLSSSLELARSASEAAVKARMKALRDGLSSGKETSGGVKPRKRPSISDVEDEESLGSSPADITKMSAKRRRISKATSDGGDDSNTAKLVCMVDEDSDGHEYYVPPSGGVPLVSTQSASMFSQLSLYYQIVISNLELCHGINCERGQKCALELRCHNCKSNPEFNTFITLSNVSCHNWHKAVKQLAKHVEDCPCLAQHTLQDVKSSRRNKKEKALAAYVSCDTQVISLPHRCDSNFIILPASISYIVLNKFLPLLSSLHFQLSRSF